MGSSGRPAGARPRRSSRRAFLTRHFLALVLGVAGWAGSDHLRQVYSPTIDEPIHVRAARELRYGPGVVSNFEHPLLMKALAGLSLPSRPPSDPWEDVRDGRRAFPVVFGLFVALFSCWAMRRIGWAAGGALGALLVLEPTLRGHASLVHTDVLLTALLGLTVVLLDCAGRARKHPFRWITAAGALYGLALASKHSALLMLPLVAVVLALVAAWRRIHPPGRGVARRLAVPVAAFLACAGLTFLCVQLAGAAGTDRGAFVSVASATYAGVADPHVVRALAERLPVGISSYAIGALQIRVTSRPGSRYHYFFGHASGTGWLLYFPVALALKLSTAAVLATALALALVASAAFRRTTVRRRRLFRLLCGRVWIPLVVGGAYFAMASLSRLNIGVRHVLPAVPLLLFGVLAGIRVLLGSRPRFRAAVLIIVVAGAALEAGAHHEREISFGNILAGGPSGLRRVLSDSNTDWGQAQDRVYARLARGDLGKAGILSIAFDMDRAATRGLSPLPLGEEKLLEGLDSLFVSVYVIDVLRAMEDNRDTYPHFQDVRLKLVPWMRRIVARARTTEAVGDEYVLLRFR